MNHQDRNTGTEIAKQTDRLYWLDYARFLAAIIVVFYHYCARGPWTKATGNIDGFGIVSEISSYGYLGVDLFFIISGFVIVNSSLNRTADKFIVARIVRLYPAFIACVTITSLFAIYFDSGVSLTQYIANLTMIARVFGIESIDGVYWTLYLEIAFYGIIFVKILFQKMQNVRWMVVIVLLIQAILIYLNAKQSLFGYSSLFMGGCILSLIYREGFKGFDICLLAVSYVISVVAAIERGGGASLAAGFTPHPIAIACSMTLFFGFFIFFYRRNPILPHAKIAGALTYPLYLVHQRAGEYVLALFDRSNKWIGLVFTIIMFVGIAFAVHLFFEKRFAKLWTSLADKTFGHLARLISAQLPGGPIAQGQ
jgi:peptidoglycan/LPS O-acetylase OafA/YrhL